tara:strand:- start:321 stop:530 length:210 start_codon:yes stop_codon:yes gene_type:complete
MSKFHYLYFEGENDFIKQSFSWKETPKIKKIKSTDYSKLSKALNIMGELGYELVQFKQGADYIIFKKKI